MEQLLLIFPNATNPEINLVKLFSLLKENDCDKFIFYDENIPNREMLKNHQCRAFPQLGTVKTEAVMNAFLKAFLKDYRKVLWIDLNHLFVSEDLINSSFKLLDDHEVVLAEGRDERISLLGMQNFYSQLFEGDLMPHEIVESLKKHEISFIKTAQSTLSIFPS